MASTAALLHDSFPHFFWVGFYLPDDDDSLVVGPYQGPLACIRLPAGRGVCGDAFRRKETVIVPDVHAVPDHIACDPRSNSEIVVPLRQGDKVVAVLDVDSERKNAFTEDDRAGLERVAELVALRIGRGPGAGGREQ
ncbi:MAG: GAF domain-containing protein [Acidobacteriota bacterium]